MGGRFNRYGNVAFLDVFGQASRRTTYSGLVQGKQGTGKSTFCKKALMEYIRKGVNCYVIDPHGEWKHIARIYGFPVYAIGKKSINVLDLDGTPLPAKISMLAEVFEEILGDDPSRAQYVAVRQSLKRTYAKFGLKIDDPTTWGRKCPTLKDVYHDIENHLKGLRGVKRITHEVILEAMEDYAIGIFSKSLVENTLEIKWGSRLNVFDVSGADPTVRKLVMLSIMSRIYRQARQEFSRKILLVDEGWRMLQNEHVARYVGEFMKEGRKCNTSLILVIHHLGDIHGINQDVADELKRGMGWHAIFHLEEGARRQAAREFGLTPAQEEFIRDAETGELLLLAGDESRFCRVILTGSPQEFDINTEYWQFTTKPEDVELRNRMLGKTRIKLPEEPPPERGQEGPNYHNLQGLKKLVIPARGLSEEDRKRLEKKGFKAVRIHRVSGHGTEIYYAGPAIKNKRHDAGVLQLAMLIHRHLKIPQKEIKISYNHGCDIEFRHQGRKFFVEYANTKASTSDLARKLQFEKGVGPENYFVVVSNEGLKKRYHGFRNVVLRKDFMGILQEINPSRYQF